MICDDCDTVARCSMCDACPNPKARDLTADEQDCLMFPLSRAEQEQLLIELSRPHPLLPSLERCIEVMEQEKKQ